MIPLLVLAAFQGGVTFAEPPRAAREGGSVVTAYRPDAGEWQDD